MASPCTLLQPSEQPTMKAMRVSSAKAFLGASVALCTVTTFMALGGIAAAQVGAAASGIGGQRGGAAPCCLLAGTCSISLPPLLPRLQAKCHDNQMLAYWTPAYTVRLRLPPVGLPPWEGPLPPP